MATCLNWDLDPDTPVKCDNCGWEGVSSQVGDIHDIAERIDPGGEVPVGECPECTCLCYLWPKKPEPEGGADVAGNVES